MISIHSFIFNGFQENTYIMHDESRECVIVDPGCYEPHEQQSLQQYIKQLDLKPVLLFNTHCHIDHILGNQFVMDTYQLPLHMHEGEIFTYKDANKWAAMFGMSEIAVPENLQFVTDTDTLAFGQSKLELVFTPGHSMASLSLYNREEKFGIVGDVLFYESIGRTDLPGGNFDTLIQSIQNKLFEWSDDTRVFSGHGPMTTIGHEKVYNPFLK
jgi:hydroxyacylglutathione hydrolase